jgi:uncharacterized protein (TIGR03437 family)
VRLLLSLFLCLPCVAQVDISKWYIDNGIGNNGSGDLDCSSPGQVTTNSGLQIVAQSVAPFNCGGLGTTPSPYTWKSGYLVSNNFSCLYCNVIVVGTFPSPTQYNNSGVWMLGDDCWIRQKVSGARGGAAYPACSWHNLGSQEIDVVQSINTTNQYESVYALAGSGQDATGCNPLSGQRNGSQHTYEMDWTSSAITWKIDGTQVCTESTQIPASPMFLMIVNMIQGPASNNTVTVNSIAVTANSNTQVCTAKGSCTAVSSGTVFSDTFSGVQAGTVYVSATGGGAYTGLDASDPLPLYVVAKTGTQTQFFNDPGWWTNGVIGNGTVIRFEGNAASYAVQPQIPSEGASVHAILVADDPSLVGILQEATVRASSTVVGPAAVIPSIGGVETASGFGAFVGSAAPGSWIEIYGSNLAVDSRTWTAADFNGPNAPAMLDGTSVTVGGQQAVVSYISPGQVNAQVPMNLPAGQQAVVVTDTGGTSTVYPMTINPVEPGLCQTMVNGTPYIVAVINGTQTYILPSQPAQPGQILNFFGTGFGPVSPAPPAGQVVTQLNRLTNALQIQIGGVTAQVTYAGLAPGEIGLYQFNVVVPSVPAGNKVPVTFTLNGVAGTQTLYTAIQ